MTTHPDAPVMSLKECPNASKTLIHDDAEYKRLGTKNMRYVSKHFADSNGFWKLASLYYDPARDTVIEYTYDGDIIVSEIFQKNFHGLLFENRCEDEILISQKDARLYLRYVDFWQSMLYMRMKFLGICRKKFYRHGREVWRFKNNEDLAQFRLYFSEYFVND